MLMAAQRGHPYASVGLHMMSVPQHHQMMVPQSSRSQQLAHPPPPPPPQSATMMRQQSSPMYGGQPTIDCHSPPVSRTYQYKKVTKPLLERKRRARINRCLDELKELMVGALEAEGENVSKLEKADILELTVRHLQRITRPRDAVEDASRFQAGFTQCATEACHFLLTLPGLDAHVGTRLVAHLTQMVNGLSTAAAAAAASNASSPTPCPPTPTHATHHETPTSRVSPPVSPTSTSSYPPTSTNVDQTSRDMDASKSSCTEEVDVESTEDEEDEESPVNYTSAALREKEKRTGNADSSSSQRCQDDDRGPMWRPW